MRDEIQQLPCCRRYFVKRFCCAKGFISIFKYAQEYYEKYLPSTKYLPNYRWNSNFDEIKDYCNSIEEVYATTIKNILR